MTAIYTPKEVLEATLTYFDGDDLASNVWIDKYCLKNNEGKLLEKDPSDMHRRLAKEFARIEKDKYKNPLTEKEIFKLLDKFKRIVPQGSPMYGIGNPRYVSISNCFTLPSPEDSLLGIIYLDNLIAQASCRRGGTGWNVSNLRPAGSTVRNAALSTSGVVSFMKRWSNTIREIGMNGRRAAGLQAIHVNHPDIFQFITCKNNETEITGTNISVQFTDDFMKSLDKKDDSFLLKWPVDSDKPKITKNTNSNKIWDVFIDNCVDHAEPGAQFIDTIHKRSTAACYDGFKEITSNPCLTYDTLVYVADGRGVVKIGELSDTGKDVPVFCLDNKNKLVIKTMRHPRKTGAKKQIYKITLDDGSTIRCTGNHKFLLNNSSYIKTTDLKSGDSLFLVTRSEESFKDIFPNASVFSQNYYWLQTGQKTTKYAEHRIIASNKYGDIPKGYIVHHKDFNSQNNNINNLCVMSKPDHDKLHGDLMRGDNNPMRRAKNEWSEEKWAKYRKNMSKATKGLKNGRYINISNKEYLQHAINLTKTIGFRCPTEKWRLYCKKNKLPFGSKYRIKKYNSITHFLKHAAIQAGITDRALIDIDSRLSQTYFNMSEQGYNVKLVEKNVYVERDCEYCKKPFWIHYLHREQCVCSQVCSARRVALSPKHHEKLSKAQQERVRTYKQEIEILQSNIYLTLKQELGREPLLKEWEKGCKKNNTPFRLGKHSRFSTYKELKEFTSNLNHKVISVELDGYEDVYNGTVDDYHNFLVGGFKGKTIGNKPKLSFIVNRQCGEQYMGPYNVCRLICINLYSYVENKFTKKALFNFDKFIKDAKTMQRLADDMVDLDIEAMKRIIQKIKSDPEPDYIKQPGIDLWEKIVENSIKDRRTGCGIVGLADMLASLNIKYDSNKSIKFCEELTKTLKLAVYDSSVELAKELGSFPVYDHNLDKTMEFIQDIKTDDINLYNKMQKYGRRNMTLMTVAPTGSVSLLTQTSSGLEPVFMLEHIRRKKIQDNENISPDFVDKTGDKWKEFTVYHHGFQHWKDISDKTDIKNSPYASSLAYEIDYTKKVELQSVIQRHIDNSISVTLNLPKNIDKKIVSDLYKKAWKLGCKGFTCYVDGSRSGVLVENKTIENNGIKRPKNLPCDIFHISRGGSPHFVLVGLKDGKIYEIFAGSNKAVPDKVTKGTITKVKRGCYKLTLPDGTELCPVTIFCSDEEQSLTRMVSISLRHGVPIKYIVQQLNKSEGEMSAFSKCIARALKNYIDDGTEITGDSCPRCGGELKFQEGCSTCQKCGYSKCM